VKKVVPFKKMWEDAQVVILENELENLNIVERYNGGFVVREENGMEFINREDFVDFWCKMLCNKEVSKDDAAKERKAMYIYDIVKNLPYVIENSDILKLVD